MTGKDRNVGTKGLLLTLCTHDGTKLGTYRSKGGTRPVFLWRGDELFVPGDGKDEMRTLAPGERPFIAILCEQREGRR